MRQFRTLVADLVDIEVPCAGDMRLVVFCPTIAFSYPANTTKRRKLSGPGHSDAAPANLSETSVLGSSVMDTPLPTRPSAMPSKPAWQALHAIVGAWTIGYCI